MSARLLGPGSHECKKPARWEEDYRGGCVKIERRRGKKKVFLHLGAAATAAPRCTLANRAREMRGKLFPEKCLLFLGEKRGRRASSSKVK